jgi:hypothetical protein
VNVAVAERKPDLGVAAPREGAIYGRDALRAGEINLIGARWTSPAQRRDRACRSG